MNPADYPPEMTDPPEERRLRCTVTRYSVDYGPDPNPLEGNLRETTTEETTGTHVRDGRLYLHNSAASAPVESLLNGAREGRGWMAQTGTPPVFVPPCPRAPRPCSDDCTCGPYDIGGHWGGRNWPKINVSAEALLEVLEER